METEMYLTEDYTGAASRIEYGKKGDQVTRISFDDYMSLVRGPCGLYHIRNEKLSPIPMKPDPRPTEVQLPTPAKATTKRKQSLNKQSNLFK